MLITVQGHTGGIIPARTQFRGPRDFDSESVSDTWGEPLTPNGRHFLSKYEWMRRASNATLLNTMWNTGGLAALDSGPIGSELLKNALENQFRGNIGSEMSIALPDNYWNIYFPNDRGNLLREITLEVERALYANHGRSEFLTVDVSDLLRRSRINFRVDPNLSMVIAMGGVHEVQIRTVYNREEYHTPQLVGQYWPAPGNAYGSRSTLKPHSDMIIRLRIVLRDWFGLDEDDFAVSEWVDRPGKTLISTLGREALTAFWVLQHQRGFRPFIWKATFNSTIRVHNIE